MIQAKDLRVGLWFNRKHGKGWTWTQMDEGIIRSIFSESLEYALNDFEPIPLTPEILKEAGFEKNLYDESLLTTGAFTFIWVNDHLELHDHSESEHWVNLNHVQSLHQLQNLYFALTNKELIIEDLKVERSVATVAK